MAILDYRNMELSIGKDHTLTVSKKVQNRISLIKFGDIYILCSYDFPGEFSLYNGGVKSCGHFVNILEINSHIYIMDYKTKKFLCSEPNGSIGTRDNPKLWEEFTLSENTVRKKVFVKNDDYIFSEKDIFSIINGDSYFCKNLSELENNIIASAILCSMPRENLEKFCKNLIHSYNYIKAIKPLFKYNCKIYEILFELFRWGISGRSETHYREIPQDFDWIVKYSKFHPEMSITELLLHFARRSISPNKSCCVVTTVRNEGIYIIEWIAHYLSLGFESIFIYSNDNSDGSDDLLYYLQSKGIIKLIKNEVSAGSDAQSKAYSDALMFNNDILDYAWCLFVDMDEFIVVNTDRFNNIKSFLLWHEQKEVDAICINWTYVGSGGNVSWFDAPMYQRFPNVEVAPNPHIKSMCKPHKFIGSQAHFPRSIEADSPVFRNANGHLHTYNKSKLPHHISTALSDSPSSEFAVIYHYFYKSFEEFLWKFSRNRGDHPMKYEDISISLEERFLSGFIKQFKENKDGEHTENALKDNTFIKELLSDSEIKRLNDMVIEAYMKRIRLVIPEFEKYVPSDENKKFFLEKISVLKNKYKI